MLHLAEHWSTPTFIKSMLLKVLTISCMWAGVSEVMQMLCHQLSQGKQVATPHDERPAGVIRMKHVHDVLVKQA